MLLLIFYSLFKQNTKDEVKGHCAATSETPHDAN